MAKWRARVDEIARMGAPAAVASRMYRQRALPTLLYVAQLTPPPADIEKLERHAISKIPRLPGSTLGCRWHLELAQWGGPSFGSALAQMQAARCRAAVSTFRSWPEVAVRMQRTASVHGTLAESARGEWWPAWWDSEPFAFHLARASRALKGDAPAHAALLPRFEDVFVADHVQSEVSRVLTTAYTPNVLIRVASER